MKRQGVRVVNSTKYRAPLGTKEEEKAEIMLNEALVELNEKGCTALSVSCTSFDGGRYMTAAILYEYEDEEPNIE